MVKQARGQRRKTARILALEASRKVNMQSNKMNFNGSSSQQPQSEQVAAAQDNAVQPTPSIGASSSRKPPSETRMNTKKKRLDELTDTSSQQNGENRKCEDPQINTVLKSSELPQKHILEIVLDILQLRDTREIFAQPVDENEVVGYYGFIKEPMDFGTMRAKLQEGMYSTLEQFEHDIFLMFDNAMRFNSPSTIYFRQARSINELAKRVFDVLKADPTKIEYEFPLKRGRDRRKPCVYTASSHSKPAAKLRGNNQAYCGSSSSNPHGVEIHPGSRNGRNLNLFKTERRETYKPPVSDSTVSSVCDPSKQLVPGNGGVGYKESLLYFVKDLGPTAQMAAFRKLASLPQKPPYCSFQDSRNLNSLPAAKQGPSHMESVINCITPSENNQLRINDAVSKGKSILTSDGMGMKDGARIGMDAFGIGKLDLHGTASKGKCVLIGDTDSNEEKGLMGIQGTFRKEMLPCGDTMGTYSALQRERAHEKAVDRDLFGPFREDITRQSQNAKTWLGLESLDAGSEGLNTSSAGIPGVCGNYKMDQLSRAVGGENAYNSQSAQNQLRFYLPSFDPSNTNNQPAMGRMVGSGLQLGLPEFLDGGNTHPRSTVYPSKIVKPSGSSQSSTFVSGFPLPSLGRMKEFDAPLDLNYGPSSSIYDFPMLQPQHGEANMLGEGGCMQQESQPKASQYLLPLLSQANPLWQDAPAAYMQLQPNEVTQLDQNAVLQQELQVSLAQNMQQQQQQQQHNEVNLSGEAACPQQGFPSAYMQPQPSLMSLLTQDEFVQPEPQLPAFPCIQTVPNEVNQLGPNVYMQQQGLQLGPGDVNPIGQEAVHQPQEMQFGFRSLLMFDDGNFQERGGPLQGHHSIIDDQYWNSQQQQNPDLALRLQTENRRL